MIGYLHIEGLGIIRKATVELEPGFNVITGESGAGKSLIARAIQLISGARAHRDLIHPEASMAKVEAEISIKDPTVISKLEEVGIDPESPVIVRRIIYKDGKSRILINDTPTTLKTLSEVMGRLVEIQGQRESLKILNPAYQLALLDRYAGITDSVEEYSILYREFLSTKNRLSELEDSGSSLLREIDYLSYVVREIESANISKEEEAELQQEREYLMHAEILREVICSVSELIEDGEPSALSLIYSAISQLERVSEKVPETSEALKQIQEGVEKLREGLDTLRSFAFLDSDPERLNQIEERLHLYQRLKSKYGETVEEVLRFYQESLHRLREIEKQLASKEKLRNRLAELQKQLEVVAQHISEAREESAIRLKKAVTSVLKDLGFEKPIFEIKVQRTSLHERGMDRVEFLFTANPEAPPNPISKIASGGELSRILLALKLVFAQMEESKILLFDEVDTGIGGTTATFVAKALRKVSESAQVIAITHFPQIASMAHHHIVVNKTLKENKTFVTVRPVIGRERQKEIERMMGGLLENG